MPVKDFEIFVKTTKKTFEDLLQIGDRNSIFYIDWIMQQFDKCSNDFEELVLIENLREVYKKSKI